MGSLMAGWDSPTKDHRTDKFQRNNTLTRLEIEAYWKSKKMGEQYDLSAASSDQRESQENMHGGSADMMKRSISLPLADREISSLNYKGYKLDDQELKKSSCWWMRSNLAFLNEPPVKAMEGPSFKYAAQYHVAEMSRSKIMNNQEMSL